MIIVVDFTFFAYVLFIVYCNIWCRNKKMDREDV